MNEKGQNGSRFRVNNESDETENSDLLNAYGPMSGHKNVMNSEQPLESVLEHSDPVKHLDLHRMHVEQRNAMMILKMQEYERTLAERDQTIQYLHTDMMNSQNNSYILTQRYKNIMEKTTSASDECLRLNTNFANICQDLNRLGITVANAKTRQNDVISLVEQTTNTFQEKILNISNNIDVSLKQVNLEKIRVQQKFEVMKNNYSCDINAYKTNLEEYATEISNLKSENNSLLNKLNESTIKINEEKETTLRYRDENIKQVNKIKELTDLLDNLKMTEEFNDALKKDNLALKERIEQLEKTNHDMMENMNKNNLSHDEIQKEKENEFKEMCTNYENLLKLQEEKLKDLAETLECQKKYESQIQNDLIGLKNEVDMSNMTIYNLQSDNKDNSTLISKLQFQIEELKIDLANTHQKLNDSANNFVAEKNELERQKEELENKNKEHFVQIEKLTNNYMKYKSKTKQLFVEVKKLRFQCSQTEQKKAHQPPIVETTEIVNNEEETSGSDTSVYEFNGQDELNMGIGILSNQTNQRYNNNSNSKRNSSFLTHVDNFKVKKHKTSVDVATPQVSKENNASMNFSAVKQFKIPPDLKPQGKKSTKMNTSNIHQ